MADYLHTVTGLSPLARLSLSRWYSSLPDALRAESHKLAEDLGRQSLSLREGGQPGEYRYAMHLLALSKMRHTREGLARKEKLSPDQLRKVSSLQVRTIRESRPIRKARKMQLLDLRLYHRVKELRDKEKMSWRQISLFLNKYHRLKISHVWLMKTYTKLKADRAKTEANNGDNTP